MNSKTRDYSFPYEPYDIQIQLMNKIYESIDESKISIIESPTGTGKSLSIICAMFKWIEDYKNSRADELREQISNLKKKNFLSDDTSPTSTNTDEVDWITEQIQERSKSKEIDNIKNTLKKFDDHVEYSKELRRKMKYAKTALTMDQFVTTKKRQAEGSSEDLDEEEHDLIINYTEEESILNSLEEEERKIKEQEDGYRPKIYYCSRTHSQLSQFINEIKKTRYASTSNEHSAMLIPLSSRTNYCINPNVNRYENLNVINEKCNELQNSKSKCPLYRFSLLLNLNDEALSKVSDLEDVVKIGRRIKACPYYGTRLSIKEAEIIVLPYNILFHSGTRQSFGLCLKDSIIIIDEAHNLLETLASVYSIELKASQIKCLYNYLLKYLTKYYKKFNQTNLGLLKQLINIVKKLMNFMIKIDKDQQYGIDAFDFVIELGLESIDVFNIIKFIDQTHLASKLYMFSLKPNISEASVSTNNTKLNGTLAFLSKIKNDQASKKKKQKILAKENDKNLKNCQESINYEPEVEEKKIMETETEVYNSNFMFIFKEFLHSLKNVNIQGKILVDLKHGKELKESSLKYVLLSASSHFKDILLECRSVILCGGTMKPFEDYIDQLFKPLKIPDSRILTFSCDHVIPPDNLITIACGTCPQNTELNYSYKNRNSELTLKQTGITIVELCKIIPKGVVVFFPSYDYLEIITRSWLKSGIMHLIAGTKKRVFKEQRNSSGTAVLLTSYSKYVNAEPENGAILFSVIGGKMSEGINFSDNLGRGVIVIGLPYANKASLELTAKMDYLNKFGSDVANEYYENLCMRAVNQSIGRAIRHKNDFATIVLVDNRYCNKQIVQNKLPDWIKSRFKICTKFQNVTDSIQKFFHEKTC